MSHSSLAMENLVLGDTLVHGSILKLDLSKTNPLGSLSIPVPSVLLLLVCTFLPVVLPEDVSSVKLHLSLELRVA
jgi:hypothetical protein